MDAFNQQNQSADISKLSDYEKRELQQSLNNELQKAKIQECTCLGIITLSVFLSDSRLTRRLLCSCPQPHRHLLEEMHDERHFEWETRQE